MVTAGPAVDGLGARFVRRWGYWLIILPPFLFLLVFFLVPFFFALKISFADSIIGIPPFTSLITPEDAGGDVSVHLGSWGYLSLSLDNYHDLFDDALYLYSYLYSVGLAFGATIVCLLLGYPMAYAMARSPKSTQNLLLLLVILPFWTSFLLRVYALESIIRDNGLLNTALISMGLIHQPLQILHTTWAVYLGIVYSYLPFMVLPLYATLEKMDLSLLEAASDLGSPPWRVFLDVTIPLSIPGIIAGSMLVFIPAIGEVVIPTVLGSTKTPMIGRVLWDTFFEAHNWPAAAAVSVAVLVLLVVPIAIYQHYNIKDMAA